MRDFVFLHINGRPHRIEGREVFLTLAELLRQRLGLTGAKVVCAEGDCGSCSVRVGRVEGGELKYKTVCSCIVAVGQMDGAHVVSVEGLKAEGGNAIQREMVACHGAQCGYCTPGFVVALQGVMEDARKREGGCSREVLRRELVGNLCRCTGYESILEAAGRVEPGEVRGVDEMYPPGELVASLIAASGSVGVRDSEGRTGEGHRAFFRPGTLGEALAIRAEHPGCTVLAGGTDVGVGVNKRKVELGTVLSIGGVAGLGGVRRTDGGDLYVGATATVAELEAAVAGWEGVGAEFAEYLRWFASPPVRNAATVGGNVMTGSPIGDLLPPLMAMGARVRLGSVGATREVGLSEFYSGYRKTVARPEELLVGVTIPKPAAEVRGRFYKVSKRKDLDISTVSAAFVVGDAGVRVAFGGVAATPVRMTRAEGVLNGWGGRLTRRAFVEAGAAARAEVTPLSDHRGSAAYRSLLIGNLFVKAAYELGLAE